MLFNATFNNITAISWRSDLLVEETGDLSQTLTHNFTSLNNNYTVHIVDNAVPDLEQMRPCTS